MAPPVSSNHHREQPPNIDPNQMLDIQKVEELTGLSKSSIDRGMAAGDFPQPKRINRIRRWKAQWIFDWAEER